MVGNELASAVADRPMALRQNGLSAIFVADNFSQSTACYDQKEMRPLLRQQRYGPCPNLWLHGCLVTEIYV